MTNLFSVVFYNTGFVSVVTSSGIQFDDDIKRYGDQAFLFMFMFLCVFFL